MTLITDLFRRAPMALRWHLTPDPNYRSAHE